VGGIQMSHALIILFRPLCMCLCVYRCVCVCVCVCVCMQLVIVVNKYMAESFSELTFAIVLIAIKTDWSMYDIRLKVLLCFAQRYGYLWVTCGTYAVAQLALAYVTVTFDDRWRFRMHSRRLCCYSAFFITTEEIIWSDRQSDAEAAFGKHIWFPSAGRRITGNWIIPKITAGYYEQRLKQVNCF